MKNLHDAIADFIPTLKSPQTARTYSASLLKFEKIAPAELAGIDETLLFPFHESLQDLAEKSKEMHLGAVTSLFAYLVYTRQTTIINLDMARQIKKKLRGHAAKRFSVYPMQDLQTLIDYAKNKLDHHTPPYKHYNRKNLTDLRDRALILTLAETGLRRSEAASLKLSDVDLDEGQAVVIGKGDKQAVVYFGDDSLQALKKYIEAREARPGITANAALFTRHGRGGIAAPENAGGHLEPSSINSLINRRAREVLGHGLSVHSLRHKFVTDVWRSTGNLVFAKELARHENVETTMRYTHVDNDELKAAHKRVFSKAGKHE